MKQLVFWIYQIILGLVVLMNTAPEPATLPTKEAATFLLIMAIATFALAWFVKMETEIKAMSIGIFIAIGFGIFHAFAHAMTGDSTAQSILSVLFRASMAYTPLGFILAGLYWFFPWIADAM